MGPITIKELRLTINSALTESQSERFGKRVAELLADGLERLQERRAEPGSRLSQGPVEVELLEASLGAGRWPEPDMVASDLVQQVEQMLTEDVG